MTSSIECTSHPKIFKRKRHRHPLTRSIRFKVTLQVNVLRVKEKLGLRVSGVPVCEVVVSVENT